LKEKTKATLLSWTKIGGYGTAQKVLVKKAHVGKGRQKNECQRRYGEKLGANPLSGSRGFF